MVANSPLKQPLGHYPARLSRFLDLIVKVRGLSPRDMHMWQVMDTVAFEDTETALETTLYNAKIRPSPKQAG